MSAGLVFHMPQWVGKFFLSFDSTYFREGRKIWAECVRVKSPDLWSNLKIDFSRSPDTDFDASWREKYNGTFSFSVPLLDDKLCAINFYFLEKAVIFIKAHWILISSKFTSNRSTPFSEPSTGLLLLFSDLHSPLCFWDIADFLAKWPIFGRKCHFPTKSTIVHEPAQLITQTQMSRFSAWLRIELSTWTSSAHHLNSAEPAQLMAQN